MNLTLEKIKWRPASVPLTSIRPARNYSAILTAPRNCNRKKKKYQVPTVNTESGKGFREGIPGQLQGPVKLSLDVGRERFCPPGK